MAINTRDQIAQELPGSNLSSGITDNNTADSVYNYEQDTNRLARGETVGTVVDVKDATRRTGIQTALSIDTWDEPLSPYAANYPHNNVYQTPNGLVQEFDDTPNNVRYHRFHPAGTYTETDTNGTEVRKIVGDNFYIVERNGYIFIGGEANITVSGKCNIMVMSDCNLQVEGKLDAVVKNDINMTTSGNFNLNVKETFKVRADDFVLETVKYNHTNVGDMKVKSSNIEVQSENIKQNVSGNVYVTADNHHLKTTGSNFVSTVDSNIDASGAIKHRAGGAASLRGDNIRLKGSIFHLDISSLVRQNPTPSTTNPSPTEDPAAAATADTTDPTLTGFVLPAPRSNPDRTPRPALPQVSNRVVRAGIENDGGSRSSVPLYPGYNSAAPYTNSSQQLTAPSSIISVPAIIPVDGVNTDYSTATNFNGQEQLTKYIKLRDVSTNAVFGHMVRSQAGLTVGHIVNNLQHLSLNVLDRIVERYGRGSFVITSGFRPEAQARGGSGVSQHGLGQAVDIQFPSLSNSDYAARAQELLEVVSFDQLLLEYQTTGSGRPWIHISYKPQGNRRQYFTMMNHQRVSAIQTA